MFSLQAAYAAPLILLAQTRQADRDKALAESDSSHREAPPPPRPNGKRSPSNRPMASENCSN